VIGRLGRALAALLRGQTPPPVVPPATPDRDVEPAERIEAARQRLKETTPPPEDE
jgi:hypothetical protein